MIDYTITLSSRTIRMITEYKERLIDPMDICEPGDLFKEVLSKNPGWEELDEIQFLELLLQTKKTCIFAESEIQYNGLDWNLTELCILGDMGIAVPVTIYDDGKHQAPEVHTTPFKGVLLYVPGALLRSNRAIKHAGADVRRVVNEVETLIVPDAYTEMMRHRMLPMLRYVHKMCEVSNTKAFITIPGLGCGQFAGKFAGVVHEYLKIALEDLLHKYGHGLSNIKAIWFDTYSKGAPSVSEINGIDFLIKPLLHTNTPRPQLTHPKDYNPLTDKYDDCLLFSFVAWDHVSWPGNDYWEGGRHTDDGVKAAATDSMYKMTNVLGHYDPEQNKYLPPEGYNNWKEVIEKNNTTIKVKDPFIVKI